MPKTLQRAATSAALFTLFFALFSLAAKSASAQVSTMISITNTTSETLDYVGTADWDPSHTWANQAWYGGPPNVSPTVCVDPNGTSGTVYPNGPPLTIAPGAVACIYSIATCGTCGTGGTITYSIGVPSSGPESPTASVAFAWTSPKDEDTFGLNDSRGAITVTTYGDFGQANPPLVGTTVKNWTAAWQTNNGSYAPFQLTETSFGPLARPANMSGYPGQSITFTGTHFDTTGLTQVLFGGEPSPSVTCSQTQCTAAVPAVGGLIGAIPVVIEVLGERSTLGSFTFLPPGPACQFGSLGPAFNAACNWDSLSDPILIFRQAGSGWDVVTNYPAGASSFQPILTTQPVGTTETFVGCYSVNGTFPYPGQQGCDAQPTTITSTRPPVHGPR